jgi:hypothetical protein
MMGLGRLLGMRGVFVAFYSYPSFLLLMSINVSWFGLIKRSNIGT